MPELPEPNVPVGQTGPTPPLGTVELLIHGECEGCGKWRCAVPGEGQRWPACPLCGAQVKPRREYPEQVDGEPWKPATGGMAGLIEWQDEQEVFGPINRARKAEAEREMIRRKGLSDDERAAALENLRAES